MRKREKLQSRVSTPSVAAWDGTIKTLKSSTDDTGVIVQEFVSVKEAKGVTGISPWTWRGWADTGVCASVKIGGRLLIPVSEIQRLLSEGLRPACKKSAAREEAGR